MAEVLFKVCDLFDETLIKHKNAVYNKFMLFKEHKSINHMQPFGSSDTPFRRGTLGDYKPRLLHAHMTHDISVVYFLSGSTPTVINVIGFFTHDDIGTGTPPNVKREKNFVKKVSSQTMRPM